MSTVPYQNGSYRNRIYISFWVSWFEIIWELIILALLWYSCLLFNVWIYIVDSYYAYVIIFPFNEKSGNVISSILKSDFIPCNFLLKTCSQNDQVNLLLLLYEFRSLLGLFFTNFASTCSGFLCKCSKLRKNWRM